VSKSRVVYSNNASYRLPAHRAARVNPMLNSLSTPHTTDAMPTVDKSSSSSSQKTHDTELTIWDVVEALRLIIYDPVLAVKQALATFRNDKILQ